MPCEFDWYDEDMRIASVRLFDPLTQDDIETMGLTLTPLLETPAPIFLLLNIREINPLQTFSRLNGMLDGMPLPRFDHARQAQSRVAIVGGGAAIKMILQLAGDGENRVKAFNHEDEAFRWLSESAVSAAGGAGFG
jgi:hypothetical protein